MVNRFIVLGLLLNILLNLAHPVTPTIIYDSGLGNYMFGVAYASIAIGQLISSWFWGKVASKYGDLNVICLGLIVYCLGQYGFYLGKTEIALIIVRMFSGIGAGAFMVSTISYLARISGENKGKNLTLYTAITVFASTMGYLLGGILGDVNVKLVFNLQVLGIVITLILIKLFLVDVKKKKAYVPQSDSENQSIVLGKRTIVLNAIVIFTLIASTCYDQSFNYYLKDVVGFSPSGNGFLKAFVGVAAFVVASMFSKFQKRKNENKYLSIFYLSCMFLVVALALPTKKIVFMVINTAFFITNGLILPLLQVFYMDNSKRGNYSEISGIFNGCKSFGMIIGALVAGYGYELVTVLPFLISGVGYLVCYIFLKILKKEVSHECL